MRKFVISRFCLVVLSSLATIDLLGLIVNQKTHIVHLYSKGAFIFEGFKGCRYLGSFLINNTLSTEVALE